MKYTLITLATMLTASTAFAQFSISPEIGFQMSKARYQINGMNDNGDFQTGIRLGANVGIGISNHLVLQGGAFFSGKGGKSDFLGIASSSTFNYIDIPVMLNYMTGAATENRFFFGAGPYWSYALGGNHKVGGIKSDLEIGSNVLTDDIKPNDFGINANIGFMLENGLYVRGMYAHGLTNILPGGNDNNSIRNASLSLSVGYNYTF
jgi:hypothetical protein